MSRILKFFCYSMLFVALNLCGSSALDYVFFYVFKKPCKYKCSCCKKLVFDDNASYSFCYRRIGSYDLMCEECKMKDYNKQIRELVLQFFPNFDFKNLNSIDIHGVWKFFGLFPFGRSVWEECDFRNIRKQIKKLVLQFFPNFSFENPNLRDIRSLSSFLDVFPIERRLGGEQCDVCYKQIDLLSLNSYEVCICGAPVHTECTENSKHFLRCTKKEDNYVNGMARRMKFISWYRSGYVLVSSDDDKI